MTVLTGRVWALGTKMAAAVIIAVALFSTLVQAEEAIATETFQSAKVLVGELQLLSKADFEPNVRWRAIEAPTSVQMRHVLARAKAIGEKINLLRFLDGQGAKTFDAPISEDVAPGQIRALLEAMISAVRELRPLYGVEAAPIAVKATGEKSPAEIYAVLLDADTAVTALGIPDIGHYDVMRIILALREDAKNICASIPERRCPKVSEPALSELPPVVQPRDIYDCLYEIAVRLQRIVAADATVRIKGGALVPQRLERMPVPNDVLSLINGLRADIVSVKARLGVTAAIVVPTREELAGRTPQWCRFYLGQVMALLDQAFPSTAAN